jgi:hypothetical protein
LLVIKYLDAQVIDKKISLYWVRTVIKSKGSVNVSSLPVFKVLCLTKLREGSVLASVGEEKAVRQVKIVEGGVCINNSM